MVKGVRDAVGHKLKLRIDPNRGYEPKEAAELASESIDNKLPWKKRWALKFHLCICTCKFCRGFNRQLSAFREAIDCYRQALVHTKCEKAEKMPEECKERLKQKLAEQQD